jgi:hypothetical protein
MPVCTICGEEVDKVIKCSECGERYCEDCGEHERKLCYYCDEEADSEEDSEYDDEDWK